MSNFAAIDVGSNAMRMAVGRFNARGELSVIASCRAPVRLGRDVFRGGAISSAVMEQGIAAFAEFEMMLNEYRVTRYRAVATSALRDASNSAEFIQRVERATGISIEVISGDEEARLVYRAVAERVPLSRGTTILLDIGGGSCEVTLIERGSVIFAESVNMGTVRLLEMVRGASRDQALLERLIRQYAMRVRKRLKMTKTQGRITKIVGTGGNIDALGELRRDVLGESSARIVKRSELRQLQHLISGMTIEQRISRLGLRPDRADVIVPAMTLLRGVMDEVRADTLLIPKTGLRDGVLLDLFAKGRVDSSASALSRQIGRVRAAALELGRRYQFDERHALHSASLALQIFDQTRRLHKLGVEARGLLEIAALVHDIGYFINSTDHEKHSAYLIRSSSLVGLSPEQVEFVATLVKFHRGSLPSGKDEEFAALPSKQRKAVKVLSAILRLVEDLDREHSQRLKTLRISVRGEKLTMRLPARRPLLVERWGLQKHKKALEEALGVGIEVV